MRNKGIFNFRKPEVSTADVPLEEKREQAQKEMNAAKQVAKQCLRNESFKKYKDQYQKASEAIVDMIFLVHDRAQNTEEFGFRLYGIISELKCLRALLKTVEMEAGGNGTNI